MVFKSLIECPCNEGDMLRWMIKTSYDGTRILLQINIFINGVLILVHHFLMTNDNKKPI